MAYFITQFKTVISFTYGPGVDEPLIMTLPPACQKTGVPPEADGRAGQCPDGSGNHRNYFYHSDALGSITYLTDEQENIVECNGREKLDRFLG